MGTASTAQYAQADDLLAWPRPDAGPAQQVHRDDDGRATTGDPGAAFAAAISGTATDVPYRAEMEEIFGESFEGVQAHVGGDAGLDDLGAHAATDGEAIAFRTGTPSRELVAHELTHVVQHRQGPIGVATSAKVSDPSSAIEREADDVARQVAAGATRVVVGGGGAPAQPQVMRSVAGTMATAADRAEASSEGQVPELMETITNIDDVNRAIQIRDEIVEARPRIAAGISANVSAGSVTTAWIPGTPQFATQEQFNANEQAIRVLDDYIAAAGQQGATLGAFQDQVQFLQADFARLTAQMEAYAASPQGAGTTDAPDNPEISALATIASTDQTATELSATFRTVTTSSGATAAHHANSTRTLEALTDASQEVSSSQLTMSSAEREARGRSAAVVAVIQSVARDQGNSSIAGLERKAALLQERFDRIFDVVSASIGHEASDAVDVLGSLVDHQAAHAYDTEIADLRTSVRNAGAAMNQHSIIAAIDAAAAAKGEYLKAVKRYGEANVNLERRQDAHRRSLSVMGAATDVAVGGSAARDGRYEVLTSLIGEGEAFIAQADATIVIGESEQTQARAASQEAMQIQRMQGRRERGTTWYRPVEIYHLQTRSWTGQPTTFFLMLGAADSHPGSAEGHDHGVNPVMARSLRELRVQRRDIATYVAILRTAIDATAP